MASQIEIINIALGKLGQSNKIPDLNDRSKARDVFAPLWTPTCDLVLAERAWPWATRALALSMPAEAAQPGWAYRYNYPQDCITALAVTDAAGLRAARHAGGLHCFASAEFRAAHWGAGAYDWETSAGEQGTTINTDVREAFLVYVQRIEDTERFPPHFVNALAARLAAEGAPAMIGEVGFNSKDRLMQEYEVALTKAGAHGFAQSQTSGDVPTPALSSRV